MRILVSNLFTVTLFSEQKLSKFLSEGFQFLPVLAARDKCSKYYQNFIDIM